MPFLTYAKLFNRNRARWIKPIILGGLAFFLFFAGTRGFLFTFLDWGVFGMTGIPAKIIAVLLAMAAWDARYTA